jgi:DNA-binding response OmpR family regulator
MTPDLPLQILLSGQSEPRRTKVGAALQFLGPADVRLAADHDTAAAWLDRITYDLVVLDFHAPGLDALELLRHMRHHTISRRTPALLCMNAATARDHTLAWQAGVTDLVIEPFESETLLRAIWRIPALSRRLAGRGHPCLTEGANDSRDLGGNLSGAAASTVLDRGPQGKHVTTDPVPDLERKITRLETRLARLCRDLWESHRRDAGLVAVQERLLREIRRLDAASEILESETFDAVRAAAMARVGEFMGTPDGYAETLIRSMAEDED